MQTSNATPPDLRSAEAKPPTPAGRAVTGPTAPASRIPALDVLRGFALLGILVMNIQSFSMIEAAYVNPTAFGDLEGSNLVVWVLGHLLADQKFMAIFSMLFGAGIVLMADRNEATGRPSASVHYRRMAWLMLIGTLHAYLLWHGDILFAYGLCGMLVFPLRRLGIRGLLAAGALALLVAGSLLGLLDLALRELPEPERLEVAASWRPPPDAIEREVNAFRGSWAEQMPYRTRSAFQLQFVVVPFWAVWRAGGLMLIGMALFRLGILANLRSRGLYLALVMAALVGGIPLALFGVIENFRAGWSLEYSQYLGSLPNYWASVVIAWGWMGAVLLACRVPAFDGIASRLASVGRMALSGYLAQTLICRTIFYGDGLGLFGRVDRGGQMLVVVGVVAFQLWAAPWWLGRFRFGPAEWLWRTLTYGKRQPLRISARNGRRDG